MLKRFQDGILSLFVKGKLNFEVEQPLKAVSAHGVGGESNNTYLVPGRKLIFSENPYCRAWLYRASLSIQAL
ncbi:MAG: hypothetical protein KZQ71_00730, partial [Candidatus Thiodiazotropha sp. (ex Lucinoma aequizonata)]|nr:hypothetical protein [Candidatus Thiodiazotropha sp. (ex Lucinoma aequizonata)]